MTTILAATQSEEKRKKLAEWRAREGAKKADEIKQRAANRGSTMHKVLEHKILGKGYADMTELGQQAMKMAEVSRNVDCAMYQIITEQKSTSIILDCMQAKQI